jgi:hypothetical protein
MSFDQLSDELILEIARHAEREYGSNMFLAPLVLCSRRLNNVVGPLLYRTFTQSLTKPASLPNLLRMVMEKPAVGAEIKNLVLMEPYFHEALSMSSYLPQHFDRCIFAIRSFERPINKMNWIQTIGESGTQWSLYYCSILHLWKASR